MTLIDDLDLRDPPPIKIEVSSPRASIEFNKDFIYQAIREKCHRDGVKLPLHCSFSAMGGFGYDIKVYARWEIKE